MISLNNDSYVPQAWHIVLLTIAVVTIAVVFNSFFARKLPLVEGLVLVLHVCGFFAILIPLWVFAPRHSSLDVWTNFSQVSAEDLPPPSQPWPSIGLACLVGLSSSIYALIGPDSCVHMAEEVKDASRTIPWAMVSTLIFNGFTGLIMVVTFAYCLGPLDVARNAPYGFAFISTFYNATGSKAGATVMTAIITILSMCSAISNVATASRQMFAFARDHGLPFGRYLAYVRPGWDIPVNAVCVSFCITSLLSLINLGSANAFNAILSIGVVALLTSYLASMSCILIKRIRGEELLPRRWSLGKNFGIVCNSIGLAYIGLAFIFAFFPLSNTPNASAMNWASAVYGGVGLLAAGWYVISARHTYIPPVSRLMKDL
jgi:amino acid transporter